MIGTRIYDPVHSHDDALKAPKIVQFRVRYDRWIKEMKTHFLQA